MQQTRPTKQEQEPASEEVTEVAPGVLRMQLPINMPGLAHVNTYALEDDRGVALVDPGLPRPGAWKALQQRLRQAGFAPRHVHTVVITHSHPDHYGNTSRFADDNDDLEVVTHDAFQTWHRGPQAAGPGNGAGPGAGAGAGKEDGGRPQPPWGGSTPWGGKSFKPPLRRRLMYRAMGRAVGQRFSPPAPTRRLVDNEVIELGRREWTAVHTPGHTADHLCLFDPDGRSFLSGDHVLPTITPHIGGAMSPLTPDRDPLAEFFDSLDRVASIEADVVLPAHGHPFADLAGRAMAIREHHDERLDKLREASQATGPATVEELSKHLFRQRSWGRMAESETYAHLEHLRLTGRAERRQEGEQLLYVVA